MYLHPHLTAKQQWSWTRQRFSGLFLGFLYRLASDLSEAVNEEELALNHENTAPREIW